MLNDNDGMGEYEKLEHQRKNPHLYTTPTQSVNADGTITTYEQVTKRLRDTKESIVSNARIVAAKKNIDPDYWFLLDELAPTKEVVDVIDTDLKRALKGFTENYARFKERELAQREDSK